MPITPLSLHEFHQRSGAVFGEINGQEIILDYGDWMAEYGAALREQGAGIIDTEVFGVDCVSSARTGNDF